MNSHLVLAGGPDCRDSPTGILLVLFAVYTVKVLTFHGDASVFVNARSHDFEVISAPSSIGDETDSALAKASNPLPNYITDTLVVFCCCFSHRDQT